MEKAPDDPCPQCEGQGVVFAGDDDDIGDACECATPEPWDLDAPVESLGIVIDGQWIPDVRLARWTPDEAGAPIS